MLGLFLTAAAYIVGSAVFYVFSRGRGFNGRETGWIMLAALVGGIFGAKLSRMVMAAATGTDPLLLLAHPDGRTIIGGIIFGWLAVEFAKKRLHVARSTGDGFALALSSGEAIGRIGCFYNGCCYGTVATVPWAVYQAGALRHPTQIYSAIVALSIFLLLCFLQKKVRYEGDLFRVYLLLFGLSRFGLEFLRERSELIFGLSIAQWVSLEIAAAMLIAIGWTYFGKKPQVKGEAETAEL